MSNPVKTRATIENEFTRKAFIAHYEYLKDYLAYLGKREHIVMLALSEGFPINIDLSPEVAKDVQALKEGLYFIDLNASIEVPMVIQWSSIATIYSPELEQQVAPPLGDPFAQMQFAAAANPRPSAPLPVEFVENLEERPEVIEKRSKIKLC